MSKVYKTGFVVTGDASGGVKAMQATRSEMDKLGETQKKTKAQWAETAQSQRLAAAAAATSNSQFGSLNSTLKNTVGALAGVAGVSFTVQGLTQSISDAKSLRDAVNQVGTLLDDTSGMEAYRKNIVEMGKEWGDTGKQASALYNIVSAGHSGLTESARILEQANILAMGGVTDVFVATDGLTSALNAYNKTASSAADVSDSFFVAMKYGKTSIEELAGSIGTVAPIAATAGASLDELMAAAAAITSTGVSTSEAMVQLKGVMLELINPAEQSAKFAKEIGLEFNTAALKAKGLSGFLAELTEKTGGSEEAMGRLFGNSRALSGAMSLTGATADKFGSALDAMTKKAGESEVAMNKLAVGAEFALDMIAIKLDALKLEVGEGALDALEPSLIFINENFDELISTTAFLTKTTVGLFATYKLGPPVMSAVTRGTLAMSAATQAHTAKTLAATTATHALRIAMLALPHVAVAAGVAAVVYAFTQYNNQQKETIALADKARASIAAYNAEQNSVEGLQARLKAEEEALAATLATAAAHEAGTSQAAQSLEKLRSMMDSGNFSGDTLTVLAQNYERLQASMSSAAAKAEGSKQRIAELKEALAALGVQTADTAEKLGGIGKAGEQTSEQSDAIEKITAALVGQYEKLTLGERAYLDYQLAQQSATAAQREQALAAFDSIEALKDQAAAQASYASTLSKSTSGSVKSLADVEKQSKRVWSALAAGKITTTQAAAAIDGLASAGASSDAAIADFAASVLDSLDPLREIERTMEQVWGAFDAGHLDADQVADYIDHITGKLKEINDVQVNPFEQLGGAISQTANGIKSIGGAMQGMYEDGSQGAKNLAVIMNAANVAAGVGAILQQGKASNPYEAFARMAAMAATVASLGVAVGGAFGGSGGADLSKDRQAAQGTGTVLGDSSAKSESIANAIDITAAATSELVGINRGMLHALQSMRAGIEKATVRIAQGVSGADFEGITLKDNAFDKFGDALNSDVGKVLSVFTFGLSGVLSGALGKGISKLMGGKTQVQDEGLQLAGGTLGAMREDVDASAYQDTRTRKNRFASWKYATEMQDLGDEISNDFAKVFDSLADSVYQGATALGFASDDVAEQINNFEIETQKISLKGLSAEDQQKEIEAVFSVMFDNLAESTVAFLPKFQQAGEALGETLARVATNVQVTEEAVLRLGFAAENSNPEQFAELSVYLIEASGGLEQFIGAMGSFVDKFAPETHKFDLLTADISRALADVGLAVPKTREEMWQLMQVMDATTESGADQIATLLRVSDTADAYYKMLEKAGERLKAQTEAYYKNYFSMPEQAARMQKQLTASFAELNQALPASKEEFRNLVESLDLTSESGQTAYDQLMDLQGVYSEYAGLVSDIEEAERQSLDASRQTTVAVRDSAAAQEERNRLLEEEQKRLEALAGIESGFERIGSTFTEVMNKAVGQFLNQVQKDLELAGGAQGILDSGAGDLVKNLAQTRDAIDQVTRLSTNIGNIPGYLAQLEQGKKDAIDNYYSDLSSLQGAARHLDSVGRSAWGSFDSYIDSIISGGPSKEGEKLLKSIVGQLGGFHEVQRLYKEWEGEDTVYAFSSWLVQSGKDYQAALLGSVDSIEQSFDSSIDRVRSGSHAANLKEQLDKALSPFDADDLSGLMASEIQLVSKIREIESSFGGLNTILSETGEINADLAAAIAEAVSNTQQIEQTFRDSFQSAFASAMGAEGADQIGSIFDSVAEKYSKAAYSQEELLNIELKAHQQRLVQFEDLGISSDMSIGKFRQLFEAAQGVVDGETLGRWWAAADVMSDLSNTMGQLSEIDPSQMVIQPELPWLDDHLQQVYSYVSEQGKALEQAFAEQVRALEQWKTVGRNLRDYAEKIRISELSPDGPAEKLQQAQESFAAMLVKAESGDLDAARKLQSAAGDYLELADSYYGRSDVYTQVFDDVATSLDKLGFDILANSNQDAIEQLNRNMLAEQEKLVRYARDELQWAQEQAFLLTGIENALGGWPDKFEEMLSKLPDEIGKAITAAEIEASRIKAEAAAAAAAAANKAQNPDVAGGGSQDSRSFAERVVASGRSEQLAGIWDKVNTNAKGALDRAFTNAGVIPEFAKGGVFTNSIVSDPTYFDMGLMGEAGDEAIVPLHMGPQGLGIKNYAGAAQQPQVVVQTDPALISELQQLRAEVVQLRSEQSRFSAKAEQQRSDQQQATEAVVRASKSAVGVI